MDLMEERRPPEADDRLHDEHSMPRASAPPRGSGPETWLAAPAVAILAVVCCAGPLLVAALAATGAGAWLAAHGYTVAAGAVIVVVAVLVWWIRARLSRG
jgi:hypothetical protein